MASKQAHKRLTKEYLTIQKSPPGTFMLSDIDFIVAKPKEDNILEW
jgi:ubiquitin-conjugating enzyme E2 J2